MVVEEDDAERVVDPMSVVSVISPDPVVVTVIVGPAIDTVQLVGSSTQKFPPDGAGQLKSVHGLHVLVVVPLRRVIVLVLDPLQLETPLIVVLLVKEFVVTFVDTPINSVSSLLF